jgi:monoamine oxidase
MKQKVVIIGAGISGLYLAYLLEEKFDVTILEARDRVGGRIYSIYGVISIQNIYHTSVTL